MLSFLLSLTTDAPGGRRRWLLAGFVGGLVLGLLVGAGALVGVLAAAVRADVSAPAAPLVTEATLNVYVGNPPAMVAADVAAVMARASVVRLQEVASPRARAGVRRALSTHPAWASVSGLGATELRILYDARVWAPAGRGRVLFVHGRSGCCGPARWIVWAPLRVRATGQVLTIADVHAVAGYCRSPGLGRRDVYAARYWIALAAWTLRQHTAHPDRPILAGGDYNCGLRRTGPAWDPGPMLAGIYRFDQAGGVDHLTTARGYPRSPRAVSRWTLAVFSDHPAVFRSLRLTRCC